MDIVQGIAAGPSWPGDADFNENGAVILFLTLTILLFLIFSQFIIAILVGVWDSTREGREERRKQNAIPDHLRFAGTPFTSREVWSNKIVYMFTWYMPL